MKKGFSVNFFFKTRSSSIPFNLVLGSKSQVGYLKFHYIVAYRDKNKQFKIKFLSKAKGKDYVVPPLEGLW
jgi:hypothetical protein